MKIILLLFALLLSIINVKGEYNKRYGFIRSPAYCKLDKYQALKSFLLEEADKYEIDVFYPGGEPFFSILDDDGKELEKIPIGDLSKDEIGNLIIDKGFKKLEE